MKETIKNLFAFGLVAMFGSLVRYVRLHRNEKFDWREFVAGMFVAWFIGAVSYCILIPWGIPPLMAAGLSGAAGYCGGSLLDLLQDDVKKIIDKMFRL